MESSTPGSMSYPVTGRNMLSSSQQGINSAQLKFRPLRTDMLLKEFAEILTVNTNSPEVSKSQPPNSVSSSQQDSDSNCINSDDFKSNSKCFNPDDEENDTNNDDQIPGIAWLEDTPAKKQHTQIEIKNGIAAPMSNLLGKPLINNNNNSVLKSESAIRLRSGVYTPSFKTPLVKNSASQLKEQKPSTATKSSRAETKVLFSQKSLFAEKHTVKNLPNSSVPSSNAHDKKLPDYFTPRRDLNPPKNGETPRQNIPGNKNHETPRQNLSVKAHVTPRQNFPVKVLETPRQNMSTNKNYETPVQNQRAFKITCSEKKVESSVLRENKINIIEEESKESDKSSKKPSKQNVQCSVPAPILPISTFRSLKINGKEYIVINKLGEGGSSQVYRCLERDTLQDRAIKMVNLAVDPRTANNYIDEVKMLRDLQQSNRVIKMYDFERVNKTLFVVMEKGDADFAVFLRNITAEPQIQTHVIICYWIEMLKCVNEIHQKGIIHSDLKPSNFLMVAGRLKLIDFGIASQISADMTSVIKDVQVGTFNYISPEALLDSSEKPGEGKPRIRISYKSDVWSLGCILYQMVYKRTPFHFAVSWVMKVATIVDKNHTIEYPPVKNVPTFLIEMMKKCLTYDMKSRPSVQELLTMYHSGDYH